MISVVVYHRQDRERDKLLQLFGLYQIENPEFVYQVTCFAQEEYLYKALRNGLEVDVLWYDVTLDGLDVAYQLREEGFAGHLVLVADTDEWALEGYRVHSSGYLLRPLVRDEVEECLDNLPRANVVRPFLLMADRRARLYLDQITCLESQMRRVIVHLRDGQQQSVVCKLDDLAKDLDGRFLKCNRSYYVNMDTVTSVSGDFMMEGGAAAPIKVRERRQIIERYYEYIRNRGRN